MNTITVDNLNKFHLDARHRFCQKLPFSLRRFIFKYAKFAPHFRNATLCPGDLVAFTATFNDEPSRQYCGVIISENISNQWWHSWKQEFKDKDYYRATYLSDEAAKNLQELTSTCFLKSKKYHGIVHAVQMNEATYTLVPAGSIVDILQEK